MALADLPDAAAASGGPGRLSGAAAPGLALLAAADPAAPALIGADGVLDRAGLLAAMDRFEAEVRDRLGRRCPRPLVMIEAANRAGPLAAWLAALRAGWPAIPVPPGGGGVIAAAFGPNVVVRDVPAAADHHPAWHIDIAAAAALRLHPETAVLLSTSGTTGAAKLVRLSRGSIGSNARAIAGYLGVTAADRAITALPWFYSYGMSVLHVQMLAGAPLVLTGAPVTDPAFPALARAAGVTSLALVPTQMEMLDAGWERLRPPALRYVTQAGGRLDPRLARRFAERARDEGWALYLMYGQTEAGPRMGWLPPAEALEHAGSIGRPVAGSRFRLVAPDGREIAGTGEPGELVFEGPGVMQGYATAPADLAAPAGPPVLHTGDIAERLASGHLRLVGRASRFLKLHGLRIGLDEVETQLAAEGQPVLAAGSDAIGLVLFLKGGDDAAAAALADRAARRWGLPAALVRAAPLAEVPLLASGKIDHRALAARAEALAAAQARPPAGAEPLPALLAELLRRPDPDPARSFRDQGGDSLGHLSVELHFAGLGRPLPEDWDDLPLAGLMALERVPDPAAPPPGTAAPRARLPADLVVRIAALCAVIALHVTDWPAAGGAWVLTLLAGASLARFQLPSLGRGEVGRMLAAMLLPILTAYYAVILATDLLWKPLPPAMFLLAANLAPAFADPEPYWFVSAYAQLMLLAALPFLHPGLRRRIAAAPFAAGLVALAGALLLAGPLLDALPYGLRQRHPLAVLELAALGWCAATAADLRQRLAVLAAALALWRLGWPDLPPAILLACAAGLGAVLLRPALPVPGAVLRLAAWTGGLALFAYIAHPAVISATVRLLPPLPDLPRFAIALAGSLALGWAMKAAHDAVMRRLRWPAGRVRSVAEHPAGAVR